MRTSCRTASARSPTPASGNRTARIVERPMETAEPPDHRPTVGPAWSLVPYNSAPRSRVDPSSRRLALNALRLRVPPVVVWSALLYVVLLAATILVWAIDSQGSNQNGRQLYETLVDGLKVGLGALIGVLSQWAQQSFQTTREPANEPASA